MDGLNSRLNRKKMRPQGPMWTDQDQEQEKKPPKKHTGLKILVAILVILGAFVALIGWLTDFMWFGELGYISVFLTKLFTQLKLGVPTFIIVTFLAYVYLKVLKRGYLKKVESNEELNHKTLNIVTWMLAAIYGGVTTYFVVRDLWFKALQFINSKDFDIKDPLYNLDVSFYVFKLDFIEELNAILIILLVAFALLTIVYYLALLSMRTPAIFEEVNDIDEEEEEEEEEETSYEGPQMGGLGDIFGEFQKQFGGGGNGPLGGGRGRQQKKNQQSITENKNFKLLVHIAENQLAIVGVLFFVMVGIFFGLKQFDLLFGSTGAVYGAGFTDVNVTLWMLRILMALAVIAAIAFVVGLKKKSIKIAAVVPVLMVLVFAVGMGGGMLIQNLVVTPDEINKESKYLERNIEYTQYAYGLDNVNAKSFKASSGLTGKDIAANEETIANIRINDYSPAKTFYNQTQSIRQYYDFNDVDVDRYTIDGDYTQTYISAREINEEKISNTWLNKHLKYTHGYGVTLSRVDQITASGQPSMMVSNIPPESSVDLQIKDPEIYYGESTNDYVLVNTSEDEFDYPDGDSNKYCQYDGNAGIKMNILKKFMFAVRERSLKLLVSGNVKGNSKILINRNIKKRVEEIMPYLTYDEDPYIVTVDGHLYWIIDAYTASSRYPYSEPYNADTTTNYVRNSVKVVIDTYTGETNYYIVDGNDPIAQTFKGIYPKLFKDYEQMPEGLRAHIRYPATMLDIQASIYQRYHMNDVKVFYQNEDLWQIASEIYGTEEKTMEPNYYIMKLPGEKSAEFVNTIPFTPKDKKNLMGLLVAKNDGDQYGDLVLYTMPKSKVVYGPMQIEAQIDQNTEISKEFSLWSSAGSTYSRGNLFVIPIEDSLLYVEPVYLEATNSSIPEVKRVIVAYNDEIAYESTLAAALNSLFGEGSAHSSSDEDADNGSKGDKDLTQSEIIEKAQAAFEKAEKAQKEGNWAKYGEYLDDLEKYLGMLK